MLDVRGGDREPSALGHGVARVDDEVHEDLLELGAVGDNAPQRVIGLGGELDVLADETTQHRRHVADHGVEVEPPRLQHLLAAESEELARQRGRATRAPPDDAEVTARGILRREPSEQ